MLYTRLQEAFVAYGAVQCGFCTPGQIMTAYALLKRNPHPTQAEVRLALKGALCRCGCYPAIERAVLAASQLQFNQGIPISSPTFPLSTEKYREVGRMLVRPDAAPKGHR